MLHIVNKSPAMSRTLDSCLRLAGDGDALLLIEDAVVAALQANRDAEALHAACARLKVHVLQPDLDARGATGPLAGGITPVDYAGFVDLVAAETPQSWL